MTTKEPKYKIGDKVWMMQSNRPCEMQVIAVVELSEKTLYGLRPAPQDKSYKNSFWGELCFKFGDSLKVKGYISSDCDDICLHAIEQFFPTKQSLINSL